MIDMGTSHKTLGRDEFYNTQDLHLHMTAHLQIVVMNQSIGKSREHHTHSIELQKD